MPKPWEMEWDAPLDGATPEQASEITAAERSGVPFHFTVEGGKMSRQPMPWEEDWDTPKSRSRSILDALDIPGPAPEAPVIRGRQPEAPGLSSLMDEVGGFEQEPAAAPPGKRTGSVIDSITPRAPEIGDFGAPVTPQAFGEVEQAMKRLTPAERAQVAGREDWRGAVARKVLERWGEPLPTMKKVMGRREDIYAQDIREGASPETAERRARLNAGAPGALDETGSARESTFDFDTAARYKDASALERGTVKGLEMLSQSGGGILKFAAEATGNDPVGIDETLAQIKRRTEAIGENQSSNALARHFENAVSSMVLNVPGLAYGAVTGAAAIPLLVMSAQVFGQEYDDGRRAGLSVGDATVRGTAFGVAEAIGERVGMPTFLKTFQAATKGVPTEELMGLLAKHTAREIPGEWLTETLEFSTDKFAPMGLTPEAGLKDYLTQMGDTLVQTVMQAGTMTGAALAPNAFALHQQGRAQGRADVAEASAMGKWATQGLVRRGIEAAEMTPAGLADIVADPASRKMAMDKWREEGFAKQKEAMGEPATTTVPGPEVDKNTGIPDQAAPGQAAAVPDIADLERRAAVVAGETGLSEIDEGRAIEKMQAQLDADAQAVKADGAREVTKARGVLDEAEKGDRVVGYVKDEKAAIRSAAQITRETGEPHIADQIGDKWVVLKATAVDAAANEAATSPLNDLPEPTDAMKAAGNYKVGRIKVHGLDVAIENPKGSERSGTDADGEKWSVTLPAHYGYLNRTEGADGDHVDVYVGPNPEAPEVYVVDQVDAKTGEFDEHKSLMGFNSREEAEATYKAGFSDGKGAQRMGAVIPMSVDEFKAWVKAGDTTKPLSKEVRDERAVEVPERTAGEPGAAPAGPADADGVPQGPEAAVPKTGEAGAAQAQGPVATEPAAAGAPSLYGPGNPFSEKAIRARAKYERLAGRRSAHDAGMEAAFPLGGGYGRKGGEQRIESSVNRAVETVQALKDAEYWESSAQAYDEGRINAQGRSISPGAQERGEKREAAQYAREQRISAAKELRGDKPAWQVPKAVYADSTGNLAGGARRLVESDHFEAIEKAIAAGETIPEDVLADYPDLRADQATPESETKLKDFTAPKAIKNADGKVIVRKDEVRTFKTEKQAKAYSKSNALKGYVPRETSDGWVLSKPVKERTPAQVEEEIVALSDAAEQRRNEAKDESIKGLRPTATDWMSPDELSRYQDLQAELGRLNVNSRAEAEERVKEKRAARVAAMQPTPEPPLTGQTESEIRAEEALAKKSADDKAKRDNAPSPDGFVLTGSSRMVDEAEARGQKPMFSLAEPVSLGEFWQDYASGDTAFQYGKSDSTDIEQIAKDYQADSNKWRVERAQRSQRVPGSFDPEMVEVINIDAKDGDGRFRPFLEVHPDPAGDPSTVFIRINETGSWPKRMDGALAYQMAMAWTANNGLKLNPDTDLLPVNRLRRTEAMISAMLKYGEKAGQIRPHHEQYIGLLDEADWNSIQKGGVDGYSATFPAGVKKTLERLRDALWVDPEKGATKAEKSDIFRRNLEGLLIASSELARRRVPALNELKVNDAGEIENTVTGERAILRGDTDLGDVGLPPGSYQSGIGGTTGLRVVATLSIQRGFHPTASDILGAPSGKQRLSDAEGGDGVLAQGLGGRLQVDPDQARVLAAALGEKALYSRETPREFRRTLAAESGIAVKEAQAVLDSLGVEGEAVESPDDLPKNLLRQIESKGAKGDVRGVFDPSTGEIYVIASRVENRDLAAFVALHESAHRGLRRLFGVELDPTLRDIYQQNSNVKTKANVLRSEHDLSIEEATEEVIADLAKRGQAQKLVGWDKFIAFIKTWLANRGFKIEWTDTMVEVLAGAAAEVGKKEVSVMTARDVPTKLARTPQTDTPAFRKWFGDSKVVDADGKPLVVYHGTRGENIEEFRGGAGGLVHFAIDQDYAAMYGGGDPNGPKVGRYFLKIENPLDLGDNPWNAEPLISFLRNANRIDLADAVAKKSTPEEDGYLDYSVFQSLRNSKIVDAIWEEGYDGIFYADAPPSTEGRRESAIAVRPGAQIKSAVGNVGTFDPENPDIRLSRSTDDDLTIGGRVAQLRGAGGRFTERITDIVNSSKTFNWWHRSLGTQYHKAQTDPHFRRVFNKGQDYLGEFSRAALDAADMAPTLLPKLEGFTDIPKTLTSGASREDVKKVGKAVLEGTLYDESGDPFKGKLWSDVELREQFGLDDKQVGLYREARAAIDTSLDLLHASEVAQMVRKPESIFGAGLENPKTPLLRLPRVLALARRDPGRAGEIVGDYLAEEAAAIQKKIDGMTFAGGTGSEEAKTLKAEKRRLLDLATTLVDKQDQIGRLKAAGYAPLQRFGKYSVTAYSDGDNTATGEPDLLYFSLHETQSEANAVKRQLEQDPEFKGAIVQAGIKSENGYMLYRGLTPDTLELFAHTLGVGEDSVFQAYLKVSKNSRSAFKRLVHRKAVSGFQTDLTRSLAAFVTSNARAVAGNWHMGELVEAADNIPKSKGDVKDEAVALVQYLQNPQEEAAFFRSLLFVNYLGGSLAAGLVNMTQPLTMTLPYLGQWGNAKASKELARAMKDAVKSTTGLDKELAAALHRGIEEGVVAPHEVHQLHAEAMRNLGSNIAVRRALTFWGSWFSATETFNRRVTFIAAYRTAKRIGAANPYQFAIQAVQETQGIYNRGNRPNWARGTIGATIFTFKQFSISYLEFLKRLPTQQRLVALAVMFLAAGMQGLPFAEDLEDLLDSIAQGLGYSWNTKQQARAALLRAVGRGGADFVMHGFSHLPGVPLDVQGRLGMGNLIPGSSVLKLNADTGREAADMLGPAGGFVKGVFEGGKKLAAGDLAGAAEVATPLAIRNVLKAVDMWQTGVYRDSQGRKVMNVTKADAVLKAIGFQPTRVAKESKKIGEQMQNIQLHRVVEDRIADKLAQARFEKSIATSPGQRQAAEEKASQAKRDLTKWNLKNPDAKIIIEDSQITRRVREMRLSRQERIIKRAPKETRDDVRRALD